MFSMREKWVVVYGYGTPSAYVDATHGSRSGAEKFMRDRRKIWTEAAERFSVHAYEDVVARSSRDGSLTLRKSALRAA